MAQDILEQVQGRLNQLEEMNQQVEDTKKQISEKQHEISEFEQEWRDNCRHVFYRVQELGIVPYTVGYHCCLCSMFEKIKSANNVQNSPRSYPKRSYHTSSRSRHTKVIKECYPSRPYLPPPAKETQDFIGTVIESIYADGMTEKERFPIPPEFQAEVDSKKASLDKMKEEEKLLAEKLSEIETAKENLRKELRALANLLNNYFGIPKVVEVPPVHWTRDDFNYDPFD